MNRLVLAELRKLATTRSIRITVLAIAALVAVSSTAALQIEAEGVPAPGTAASFANLVGASSMPSVLMLIIGILAAAGEAQHRTLTQTYLTEPRRGRVVVAKLTAVAVAGFVAAVGIMTFTLLVGVPQVVAKGVPIDLFDGTVGRVIVGNLLGGTLLGPLGVAVGSLVRNQLGAVVGALGWTFIVEGLLRSVFGVAAVRWLPGVAAQGLAGLHDSLTMPVATALVLAYTVGLAAVAARLTVTRDVT